MKRRELITMIAAATGAALSPGLASALQSGASLEGPGLPDESDWEREMMGLLAERIIPRTDTPGALEAGVDGYISMALAAFHSPDEIISYRRGLKEVDELFLRELGQRFLDSDQGQQEKLLALLDERTFGDAPADSLAEFWTLHKQLTLAGYYTSEIGATLELRPMPMGDFDADIPWDPSMRAWN